MNEFEQQLYGAFARETMNNNTSHDAHLNAMFAKLRAAICQSQDLVMPGCGAHELYRESLAAELKIEAEIIQYVAERERRHVATL